MKYDFKITDIHLPDDYKKGEEIWVNLNPYCSIIESGVFVKDMKLGTYTDSEGDSFTVKEFGGGGHFGQDSFSWQWVKFSF
jgi:hypothetical protein